MVRLEKEVKKGDTKPNINKWQTAWRITKAFGEIGFYGGLMYGGYYLGSHFGKNIGGNEDETYFLGMLGAIIVGVFLAYRQDNKIDDDEMIPS